MDELDISEQSAEMLAAMERHHPRMRFGRAGELNVRRPDERLC